MPPPISERLQFLLDYVYPVGSKPYSQTRLAELASTPGNVISAQQVNGILTGRTKNPSFHTIAGLAEFFKVPESFFSTTDDDTWEKYENWIRLMRDRADNTELYAARFNKMRTIRDAKKAQRRKRT